MSRREHDFAAAGTEERARGLAHAGRNTLRFTVRQIEHVDLIEGVAGFALALEDEALAVGRPVTFAGAFALDGQAANAAEKIALLPALSEKDVIGEVFRAEARFSLSAERHRHRPQSQ